MKARKDEPYILAGDIGGTKSNLGLFLRSKDRPVAAYVESYSSQGATNLETIITKFMERCSVEISGACLGVAGPVVDGKCKATNLPWFVSEPRLKQRFKWPHLRLVNDLVANAMAIPLLKSHELASLNNARTGRGGNIAILAPGTGLGQALLVYHEGRYSAIPSEGGHVSFSPTNENEAKLWQYLHKRLGHVSAERILSGPGLVNIYSWLKDSGHYKEPVELKRLLTEMDPAKVITDKALAGEQPLCVESLAMFVSILGSAAGNLALTGFTRGGVYLGGGIAPKILPALRGESFMNAFTNKGRLGELLKTIPVRVILNQKAALLGAAKCAFEIAT